MCMFFPYETLMPLECTYTAYGRSYLIHSYNYMIENSLSTLACLTSSEHNQQGEQVALTVKIILNKYLLE